MVKRYTLAYIAGATEPGFHDYVLASDYDALAALHGELLAAAAFYYAHYCQDEADGSEWVCGEDQRLAAQRLRDAITDSSSMDNSDPLYGSLKAERDSLAARLAVLEQDNAAHVARCYAAEARLAALELAAWDACEVAWRNLENPEDWNSREVKAAWDAVGELLPAKRPADSADAAIRCPCNCALPDPGKACAGCGRINEAPKDAKNG